MKIVTSKRMIRVLWMFFAILSLAHAQSLFKLRETSKVLSHKLYEQDQKIEKKSSKLDQISKKIHRLKKKQKSNVSILGHYRLQSKLKEAQKISDQLSELSIKKRETELRLQKTQALLIQNLNQRIEHHRKLANDKKESWTNRQRSALELEKLLAERIRLSTENPAHKGLPPRTAQLIDSESSPEDLQEKLVAIQDLEKQMVLQASLIQQELKEVQRQQFLRRELTHLMDEEAFFGEQGFIRGSATRAEKEEPENLKDSETAKLDSDLEKSADNNGSPDNPTPITEESSEEAIQTEGVEVAIAETENVTHENENVGNTLPAEISEISEIGDDVSEIKTDSGSENLEGFSRLDAASVELTEPDPTALEAPSRDPLAQTANEFGVPLEQKKDFATRIMSVGSIQNQIVWLKKRLQATHRILESLHQKADALKNQLQE